ncbi:hypothetical protein HCU64_06425 [Methylobacterium sp. C25]|uniref:hypothetical protein n=1 Tax=Methylobacterium sp. C25 TaxID=2721622 RepID=UPI001F311750|nr:hypothetical protein [Methylobacterium sp. C25]MCE4223381.1 hypothetical protein [Methylobacterium sp. C25]
MLIDEAHAQAAEAAKAATGAADVYINQGVLGATCIIFILLFLGAVLVIRALYQDIKALQASKLEDQKQIITAQNAATAAAEKIGVAMEGIRVAFGEVRDTNEDLNRKVELGTQEIRHSLANARTILETLRPRERS